MKVKTLSLLAGAGSLLLAGTASADFLGISLELQSENAETGTGPSAGFGASTTYRIYANFSVDTLVTAVYGLSVGDTSFFTLHSGSIFNQVNVYGNAQITPPNVPPQPTGFLLDSYYTLGGLAAELAPGTLGIIANPVGPNGHGWTGSWSAAGDGEFAWFLSPDDAPTGTKVLLAQLTVSGHASDGSVGLFEGAWGIQANGVNLFDFTAFEGGPSPSGEGLSYFTNIPAPGVLALLGIAGLVGARRRRA